MNQDASGKELAEIIASAKPNPLLKKWLVLAAVLILAGTIYGCIRLTSKRDTGPIYNTQNLKRGDLSIIVTATGNLATTNQVTVGSELSGTIAEVYVDLNDMVKKDEPLAKLDTAKLTQQTERNRALAEVAKSKVSQADATLLESSSSLARFEELNRLSGGKTPSKADMVAASASVARAKADLESAKALVAQAEADLKSSERDLSKTIIRSPFDGIILTRTVVVGQTVAASFTAPVLFLIAEDLQKMNLVVAVAEADIGLLKNGKPASFTVDAWPSRAYSAIVKRVAFSSVMTNNVVTYNTELEVANDDLSLRPGMTATADISVAKSENVLLIPKAALRFDPAVVEALSKEEKPKKTFVQSLTPASGRLSSLGQRPPKDASSESRSKAPHVWILKDGKPVKLDIKLGLSDGLNTEATGEGLVEGIPIIVSAKPPVKP